MNIRKINSLSPTEYTKLMTLCDACGGYEPFYCTDDSFCVTQLAAFNDNNDLIGFIAGIGGFDETTDAVEFTALVHPKYRKQGIFKALLKMLSDEFSTADRQKTDSKASVSSETTFLTAIPFELYKQCRNSSLAPTYAYSELLMMLKNADIVVSNNHVCVDAKHNTSDINYEDIECCFSDDNAYYLMYLGDDDEPVAVCNLDYENTFTNISSVFVDEDMRGKGLGTLFMQSLIKDYFDNYSVPLVLNVRSSNTAASCLYKKCGFNIVEQVDYYSIRCI